MTFKIWKFKVGCEMPDGTIYAGISPDNHKPFFVTPQDASGTYTFNEAAGYAKTLSAHRKRDWRVPTKNELKVLYRNRNEGKLKDTFNGAEYWSDLKYAGIRAYAQSFGDERFSDGIQSTDLQSSRLSLRCLRYQ